MEPEKVLVLGHVLRRRGANFESQGCAFNVQQHGSGWIGTVVGAPRDTPEAAAAALERLLRPRRKKAQRRLPIRTTKEATDAR